MRQQSISVLVVEDNRADARLVEELLAESGTHVEVQHADGLQYAVDKLLAGRFSVVLLDLGLGDSQGLSTLLRLRSQVPHLPVIVLTGLDDDTLALQSVREGAQDYLVKGQLDAVLLLRSITYAIERKRLEEERNHLLQSLRDSARDIFRVQEEERRRVSYELHDGLIQLVTAADMHLEGYCARFRPRNADARKELREISRQLKLAVGEGRSVLSQLRPSILDDFGPVQALRQLLSDIGEREGWQWKLEDALDERSLDPLIATAIYRICQEALNNVRKHSAAKQVKVSLQSKGDAVSLMVQDWGRGFNPESYLSLRQEKRERLGLLGMLERAQLLGGNCTVSSTLGSGTTIIATIPVTSGEADGIW